MKLIYAYNGKIGRFIEDRILFRSHYERPKINDTLRSKIEPVIVK